MIIRYFKVSYPKKYEDSFKTAIVSHNSLVCIEEIKKENIIVKEEIKIDKQQEIDIFG